MTIAKTIHGILGPLIVAAAKYVKRMLTRSCATPFHSLKIASKKKAETPILKRCFRAGLDRGMRMKIEPRGYAIKRQKINLNWSVDIPASAAAEVKNASIVV
jgi:hypothetical protein